MVRRRSTVRFRKGALVYPAQGLSSILISIAFDRPWNETWNGALRQGLADILAGATEGDLPAGEMRNSGVDIRN
jgi:hypothetical protein